MENSTSTNQTTVLEPVHRAAPQKRNGVRFVRWVIPHKTVQVERADGVRIPLDLKDWPDHPDLPPPPVEDKRKRKREEATW